METSEKISLSDGVIRYGAWELPIDRVRVFGESTTDNGPWLDDYHFCFAVSLDKWYEVSFYAEGRAEFIKAMSVQLSTPIELRLVASTAYASRVIWPPPLADKPMFVYTDKWPSNPLLRGLVKLVGGPFSNAQTYSHDVEQYLRDATRFRADDSISHPGL